MLELVVQLAVECLSTGRAMHPLSARRPPLTPGGPSCHFTTTTALADAVAEAYDAPVEQTTKFLEIVDIAFGYLGAIFNPECSYHQRCRDRTGNTGTYV